MVAPAPTQTQTAHDILDALAADQFAIYYQPILDLTTGAVTMAEALIRWNHPERGLIGPDEFIRRAEQTGVITALGDWIVTRACRDASACERTISVCTASA